MNICMFMQNTESLSDFFFPKSYLSNLSSENSIYSLNNSGLTSRVAAGQSLSEYLSSAWTTTGSQTSFRTWPRSVWTAWQRACHVVQILSLLSQSCNHILKAATANITQLYNLYSSSVVLCTVLAISSTVKKNQKKKATEVLITQNPK